MIFKEGRVYEGQVENGSPHGKGRLLAERNGVEVVVKGKWKQGRVENGEISVKDEEEVWKEKVQEMDAERIFELVEEMMSTDFLQDEFSDESDEGDEKVEKVKKDDIGKVI